MKNLSAVLSALALTGVIVLFILHFSSGRKGASDKTVYASKTGTGIFKIAYVDIDSFETNYEFLKAKREAFNKRQTGMQNELERSAQQFQNKLAEFQRKIESRNISQVEGEATQKQLAQMQQSLQLREQALTEQLLKEKDVFNQKLHDDLSSFLRDYNKEKGFDYILSYSELGSIILYANNAYNITGDVIAGMNERSQKMSDTTDKK